MPNLVSNTSTEIVEIAEYLRNRTKAQVIKSGWKPLTQEDLDRCAMLARIAYCSIAHQCSTVFDNDGEIADVVAAIKDASDQFRLLADVCDAGGSALASLIA